MINYVTQSGCCLGQGQKGKEKKEYASPLKVAYLAHFMSFSTASSSKNFKKTNKKQTPQLFLFQWMHMLIYWIHLRQKGFWISVESALWGPPLTPSLHRWCPQYCRELPMWREGGGVLWEGKHWVVGEVFLPHLSAPCSKWTSWVRTCPLQVALLLLSLSLCRSLKGTHWEAW